MSKYKILYVCNDLDYFNMHWRYRALCSLEAGYQVTVAVPTIPKVDATSLQWCSYSLDRKSRNVVYEAKSLQQLERLVAKVKPDMIHSITVKPNLYAGLVARKKGIPIVISVPGLGQMFAHNNFSIRLIRYLTLSLYRYIGKVESAVFLFENYDDRALFLEHDIGNSRRCIRIPGAGVDIEKFHPRSEPNGIPVVMLCSRMLWDKGIREFIDAATLLRQKGVSARFVLVGKSDPGNSASIPSEQLESWNQEGVVEWWGHQDDMPKVLAASDIVCLPSSYREGIPRVLIEAAACGRAIITTDAPGCREIVRDGTNGLLVPVGDVGELALAIERLIMNPELRASMGQRGRQIVVDEYSQEQVVSETLSVYHNLLS
ncbi:MAG: glycosyltransferase family 4 protein [Magnetococcales bacterium]|nr:glycosyltransferase family 4 protein [Magnetococcales bacterium]